MDRSAFLREFIDRHELGVIATAAPDGAPEADIIEIAVLEDLFLVFNTFSS